MKAAGRAFLTGHPKPSARFLPLAPAAENGIFKEHLVRGRGQMGRRSSLLFDNYLEIGEQVRRTVNPSAAAARGYSYLAPGPIDEPNWAFAVDGDEFPLTVISWGYSLKTAVFLLSVVRSIASEHKARMPPRSAAIIRRRMEAVTAAAAGYPPKPTKAVFSPAADARNGCEQTISTPSTRAPPLSDHMARVN
jgi:hypothetical protein